MADTKGYVEQPVMMRTTAPNQNLSDCVLLIERGPEGDDYAPSGSAFLIEVDKILYGVTARHVVQNRDEGTGGWAELYRPLAIRAIRDEPEGEPESFRKALESRWFSYDNMYVFHEDPTVDIAVFPTYRNREIRERTKALAIESLQSDQDVLVGEDIHLFGFPGFYGFRKGTPVVRGGTIAYKLSAHRYLLDVTSWHGDSGGLVCSKPYFGVPIGKSNSYQWQMGGKVIGLLTGYQTPAEFGLPPELEPFRTIVSAQAISEVFDSPAFSDLHARLVEISASMQDDDHGN